MFSRCQKSNSYLIIANGKGDLCKRSTCKRLVMSGAAILEQLSSPSVRHSILLSCEMHDCTNWQNAILTSHMYSNQYLCDLLVTSWVLFAGELCKFISSFSQSTIQSCLTPTFHFRKCFLQLKML